jgi:predicted TPR repeat methyltransferase
LGFSVDTSELEKAIKALDDVTKAAERTEQASGKVGELAKKWQATMFQAEQTKHATDSATAAAERYLKQLQAQFDMLGKSSSAQAAYRTAVMGGTEAQQKQAAALATLIDKRKRVLSASLGRSWSAPFHQGDGRF